MIETGRELLAKGFDIVTGAHPTVVPILLLTAHEFGLDGEHSRIRVYQSRYFQDNLPESTKQLGLERYCDMRWVEQVSTAGDDDARSASLLAMRLLMISETAPALAFFIGGMEGVQAECELIKGEAPSCRMLAFERPGGAAAQIEAASDGSISVTHDGVYGRAIRTFIDATAADR